MNSHHRQALGHQVEVTFVQPLAIGHHLVTTNSGTDSLGFDNRPYERKSGR